MGAFAVGKKVIQVEGGLYYANYNHELTNDTGNGLGAELQARYGVWKEQLEIVADVIYQKDNYTAYPDGRSGLKNLNIGLKYLIYDPFKNYEEKVNIYSWKAQQRFKWRRLVPAIAVYAGATATFDNPFLEEPQKGYSPKIMIALQQHFAPGWVLNTNLIADKMTTDTPAYGYITTLTHSFSNNWALFAEHQGFWKDSNDKFIARGGVAYLINKNCQVDASYFRNLDNLPTEQLVSLGLSWRMDKNHNPVKLPKKQKN